MAKPSGPFDQPSQVNAEQGQVLIDGPDGVALAMTPDAAEETGRRLLKTAADARRQREEGISGEGAA